MNPRLLECFNRRRLSVGEPRFCAPFREYPTPAAAGFDQQELDRASADPVADRSDLFALADCWNQAAQEIFGSAYMFLSAMFCFACHGAAS